MLLLMLLGVRVVSADGVRAYGNTTYSAVISAASTQASVSLASASATNITNATTTEE